MTGKSDCTKAGLLKINDIRQEDKNEMAKSGTSKVKMEKDGIKTEGFLTSFFKAFGKNPSKEQKKEFADSPNYRDGAFQNLEQIQRQKIPFSEIRRMFSNRRIPDHVPSQKADLKSFEPGRISIVWFGHSTCLIHYNNWNILVDPILRKDISPLPNYIKTYPGSAVYEAKDLPDIDLLILTHDHYDHMDYHSLMDIKPIVKQVAAPLGISSHLYIGDISKQSVTEMDWYDEKIVADDLRITATPSRHFSNRFTARNQTLWHHSFCNAGTAEFSSEGTAVMGSISKPSEKNTGPLTWLCLKTGNTAPIGGTTILSRSRFPESWKT